jgi:hypothetical protein
MIYELKKYVPAAGKAAALKDRFAKVTLPIFARVGIHVEHVFESPAEPEALYYMTRFDTAEQRDAAWKAFGADPEWKAAKTASETDGPLLGSQTSVELHPAACSPSK